MTSTARYCAWTTISGGNTDAAMVAVYWKSTTAALRTRIGMEKRHQLRSIRWRTWYKLGSRLFAINRDGSHLVSLLSGNHDLAPRVR
jgi:hypothetical protein